MIRHHRVQDYLERLRPERDALLAEMEALARLERIPIVEWETGRLLATLVAALRPALVLEVGTAIGYSTLHMARELEDGATIVTHERQALPVPPAVVHDADVVQRGRLSGPVPDLAEDRQCLPVVGQRRPPVPGADPGERARGRRWKRK